MNFHEKCSKVLCKSEVLCNIFESRSDGSHGNCHESDSNRKNCSNVISLADNRRCNYPLINNLFDKTVSPVSLRPLANDLSHNADDVYDDVFINNDILNENLFGAPDDDDENENDDTSIFSASTIIDENISDNKCFTFLHWNIEGLKQKIFDKEFISFVTSYNFVCLVETFVETLSFNPFTGYETFYAPSVKWTRDGRPSGGVLCLIRQELLPFVKQVKVNVGNVLLFIIDKSLFGIDKDLLYVCCYLPPEGSKYYNEMGLESDGVSVLENCIVDNVLLEQDVYVLINGDLNSRTSNVFQYLSSENDMFDESRRNDFHDVSRNSKDGAINAFGKTLLNMCISLDLCIMNGVCSGDQDGGYTYICDAGSSVNDYFIMSGSLFARLFDDAKMHILDETKTKHMPILLSMCFPRDNDVVPLFDKKKIYIDKFVWNSEQVHVFDNALLSNNFSFKLFEAFQCIEVDVKLALSIFNECIREVAYCMKKRVCVNSEKKLDWFDIECKDKRKELRKLLKKYKRTSKTEDRHNFCKCRREYKYLLQRKKKEFNEKTINMLVDSIDNQQSFWDTLYKICPKKSSIRNNLKIEDWHRHFKTLLEKEDLLAGQDSEEGWEDVDNQSFNRPISIDEVLLALRKLKPKKAAGPDQIIGEILKQANLHIIPFLVKFFNVLFDNGIYPEQWTEAIILPLYKKGNVNDTGNYRGISLSDTSSKLYGMIVNRRIQNWVEQNNLTGEYQAGFKSGYSCCDHIFTLMACVQKQFSNNRKLYACFIDFEKCFDTINRNLLWPILLKNGIKGKLFKCIKSMYLSVKARVRCGDALTDRINCTLGVKQGDICSPVLFSLFINELALEVIRNGRHGVTFPIDSFELFILLLADDVVLLSETVIGLQRQLNSLSRAAESLKLRVNLNKSNIVVFRKGGYLGQRERWIFNGNPMPVVNAYKYLGIYFSTKLSFSAACRDMASKAKKALLVVIQRLRHYNNSSFNVFIKIFDVKILPIMLYGAEVWGLEKSVKYCEELHLYAIKKFLAVDIKTPNDLVYRELNRYPITITCAINCLRYWLKLLRMNENRLPKKAYLMLYQLDERGKKNWVTNVRTLLFRNGFGIVWHNQNVENDKVFLKLLRQRLIDTRFQNLLDHVNTSERFDFYSSISTHDHFTLPKYLSLDMNRQLKVIMTRFRFGVSDINVHKLRYRNHNQAQLLCNYCKDMVENEVHFLLCCPLYSEIREKFIPLKYYREPNLFRATILLNCNHDKTVENLCRFIYQAFRIRDIVLS